MKTTRTTNILFFLILLSALVVRLWGINFGLPYYYFADEWYQIYWAFFSGSHALRPLYYLYAPFVPIILLFEFLIYYIGGYMFGFFSTAESFFIAYVSDATVLTLIGRITMVFFGGATIWLVFLIGRKFFNQRIGVLAAFFLAFSFLHVKESHYIKQDVLMTFFVLACFYFCMRILQKESVPPDNRSTLNQQKKVHFILKIVQKGRLKDYFFCGLMLGLGFSTKYQAVLLFPIIFLVHFLTTKKIVSKNLIVLGVVFLVTFCIINPYFILETKYTIEQSLAVAAGSRVIYPEHLHGKPVWWWYFFVHIPQGIGYPLYLAGILGFFISFLRCKKKKEYFFIPLLPITFFITIDFFTKMHFARYAVILLPFFALGAGTSLDYLGNNIKSKQKNLLISVLAIFIIFPTFLRTVQFDYILTVPDTRTIAKQWFEKNVPAGSKVLVVPAVKPEHPGIVPLALDTKGIDKRIKDAKERGLEALYLRSLKQASKGKVGYDIVASANVDSVRNIFIDEQTPIEDIGYYVDNNVGYIILNGWSQNIMSKKFEKSLYDHYKLIKEFRPSYNFNADPHLVRVDYAALDSVDIFRRDMKFGPVISIYKLTPN